jgi:hypothetical protein
MSENQAEFNGWAKVEVMGHQSHVGYVTTEAYGQAVMFRIDRPAIAEREETLESSEWVDAVRCPKGTIVKRGPIEPLSVLVGSGSIYRIIPCTEAAAIKAIESGERRPLMLVRLPESAQVAGAVVDAEFDEVDDRGIPPDDEDGFVPNISRRAGE